MATMRLQRTPPGTKPAAPAPSPVAPATTVQGQVEATIQRAVPTAAKRRFIGGVSTRPDSKSAARQAIAAELQLIAINNAEIDRLVAANEIAQRAVEGLMKNAGLTHEEAYGYVASYVEQFSRASRSVRVLDYRKKLNDEAKFLLSVEVPINKAAQFLGEKELAEVCDHQPATSRGFVVRIEEAKTKVTRKLTGG